MASKWEALGDSLRFSPAVIARVSIDNPVDSERACREILDLWLSGDPETRQPVSWRVLIQAIRETDPNFEPFAANLTRVLLQM